MRRTSPLRGLPPQEDESLARAMREGAGREASCTKNRSDGSRPAPPLRVLMVELPAEIRAEKAKL